MKALVIRQTGMTQHSSRGYLEVSDNMLFPISLTIVFGTLVLSIL